MRVRLRLPLTSQSRSLRHELLTLGSVIMIKFRVPERHVSSESESPDHHPTRIDHHRTRIIGSSRHDRDRDSASDHSLSNDSDGTVTSGVSASQDSASLKLSVSVTACHCGMLRGPS
eukprot:1273972-Rhodomonas_salina.1